MHPSHNHRLRRLDWRPDKPSFKDYKYSDTFKNQPAPPKRQDLRPQFQPIRDQGNLGCGTGFGAAAVHGFIHPKTVFSPLFIYYWERVLEGTVRSDSGAEIRDAIKVLQKYGAATEKLWPYVEAKFRNKPPQPAIDEALNSLITAYYRCETPDDFHHCLGNDASPVVFGFTCFSGIDNPAVAKYGILPLPDKREKDVGGHCVVLGGYGDAGGFSNDYARLGLKASDAVYVVRNHWGTGWGLKGYYLMDARYVENTDLSTDFWTVRK